ncbi:Fosmidomycin resistance protein [Bacillus coahuilensis p1.1.43]|uniref:Fosmidomycin resistance protein n=1 Tax=Bacillus coahuilensis p1.1.43 TaxID=1150625 RepID=A0A147KC48_9BACI|nr:MFS transporter [Bacillus coahuilensis]KUP09140.1 Fosmidomycin resistance protein [Bacillus coahuilensis p1.1.43]
MSTLATPNALSSKVTQNPTYKVLIFLGICHLLNDTLQAIIPAMFPILEASLGLNFTQLGLIAFVLNMVSSCLQPVVGIYTDKSPLPYLLPVGLSLSLIGVLGLGFAPSFLTILLFVVLIGFGSAVFHPEGSRVAYLAAGNRRGLAQSIYQVGGNTGHALAPVMTAFVLVPLGQKGASIFSIAALLAVVILFYIAKWYKSQLVYLPPRPGKKKGQSEWNKEIILALVLLVFIVFARSWYSSAISNFYAFYVISEYGMTIAQSQAYIFAFLITGAVGTFFGGPVADRFGRKNVIAYSLLLTTPMAIILPYLPPFAAFIVIALMGLVLMSSFSVMVVYAQELMPGKIGTMSGLIVGLAFGMGAIGSIALGVLIDTIGLNETMLIASFLPALGVVAYFLPKDK